MTDKLRRRVRYWLENGAEVSQTARRFDLTQKVVREIAGDVPQQIEPEGE